MKELKNKLIEVSNTLKAKENKAFEYFENLYSKVDENPKETIDTILKSSSIIQYANFDNVDEKIFDELWKLAKKLKDEN